MNVGPTSCASCAPTWSCGNRSSNRSWPDSPTSNSRRLRPSWHRSTSTTSPCGPSSSAPARPSAWRPETRAPQNAKNDNMLVVLFGSGVPTGRLRGTPGGLPPCQRERARGSAVGGGREAGLFGEPTWARGVNRECGNRQRSKAEAQPGR